MKMLVATAAALLTNCSGARAQTGGILASLGGDADNRLIAAIQARNPGTLCAIVSAGHARLMSYGNEAAIDLHGVPTTLTYHPHAHGGWAEFTGKNVSISGNLIRESVTRPFATVSHHVSVQVKAAGRAETLQADWTCQATLPTVRVIH